MRIAPLRLTIAILSMGAAENFVQRPALGQVCEGYYEADTNDDNIVDPLDAGQILSRLDCTLGSGDSMCDAADVNGDGSVDPLDSGYVLSRLGCEAEHLNSRLFEHPLYCVGCSGWSPQPGDFDNDGDVDFAVLYSPGVSVLINRSDGSFVPGDVSDCGYYGSALTASDLDGDDWLDLAVVHEYASTLSICSNVGNNVWVETNSYPTGYLPDFVRHADVEADGDMDLIIGGSSFFQVFRNQGSGDFVQDLTYFISITALQLGDIDGNGYTDVICQSGTHATIFLNVGDGTFSEWQSIAIADDHNSLEVVDLDEDGDADILTSQFACDIAGIYGASIHANLGNGEFAEPVGLVTGNCPLGAAIGDLDGDGDLDVLSSGEEQVDGIVAATTVLYNQGGLVFSQPAVAAMDSYVKDPMLRDVNSDGTLDIIGGDGSPLEVFENTGGEFSPEGRKVLIEGKLYDIAAEDLNKDGYWDLAVANNDEFVVNVLFGLGDFEFSEPVSLPSGIRPHSVATGDIDNDLDHDIVATSANDDLAHTYFNDGLGNFPTHQVLSAGGSTDDAQLADMDLDDDLDLVLLSRQNYLQIRYNTGDGQFIDGSETYLASEVDPESYRLADLDGDGDIDVIVQSNYDLAIRVYFNDGNRIFTPSIDYLFPGYPWGTIGLDDIDQNGSVDVMVAYDGVGGVSLLWNDGHGAFSSEVIYTHDELLYFAPTYILPSDVNNDRLTDLAIGASHSVFVLLQQKSGDFVSDRFYGTIGWPETMIAHDFDFDGDSDLVVTDKDEPYLGFLENRTVGAP